MDYVLISMHFSKSNIYPVAFAQQISQEQTAVPSLPKAPRLQLSSPTIPSEEKSLQESHVSPKNRTNEAISFNMADLEQGGPKQVAAPGGAGSGAIPDAQEPSSPTKGPFGGGDTGFSFNFNITFVLSFSFFYRCSFNLALATASAISSYKFPLIHPVSDLLIYLH